MQVSKTTIAISISHIHRSQEIIAKSAHYTTNVNSTKAELFTIRCEINYAIHLQNVTHIIIITDAIPAARKIFNMSVHPYQLHSITILKDLKKFFNKDFNNSIDF